MAVAGRDTIRLPLHLRGAKVAVRVHWEQHWPCVAGLGGVVRDAAALEDEAQEAGNTKSEVRSQK